MGNYELLKAAINEVIKANGRQEITGEVLNQVLLSMVNSLGAGYQCMGVATPSTNPGTPDQNVFYFATQAGTYTNFDAIELQAGISVLMWDGDWASQTWFTVESTPTNNSQNLIASGAVFNALKLDGGAYDVSAHNSGATFASLSALLNSANLNTLIPTEIRHGGMSIKFIQSSDNKYVQYRYMEAVTTTAAFTNVANWQGVDDEPTAGSDNLVKSGGAAFIDTIEVFSQNISEIYTKIYNNSALETTKIVIELALGIDCSNLKVDLATGKTASTITRNLFNDACTAGKYYFETPYNGEQYIRVYANRSDYPEDSHLKVYIPDAIKHLYDESLEVLGLPKSIDTTPTENSHNFIESNAVFQGLENVKNGYQKDTNNNYDFTNSLTKNTYNIFNRFGGFVEKNLFLYSDRAAADNEYTRTLIIPFNVVSGDYFIFYVNGKSGTSKINGLKAGITSSIPSAGDTPSQVITTGMSSSYYRGSFEVSVNGSYVLLQFKYIETYTKQEIDADFDIVVDNLILVKANSSEETYDDYPYIQGRITDVQMKNLSQEIKDKFVQTTQSVIYQETRKVYVGSNLLGTATSLGAGWSEDNGVYSHASSDSVESLAFATTVEDGDICLLDFYIDVSGNEMVKVGIGDAYQILTYNGTHNIVVPVKAINGTTLYFTPTNKGNVFSISNIRLRKIQETGEEVILEQLNTYTDNHYQNYGAWNVFLGDNTAENAVGSTRCVAIGLNSLRDLQGGHRNVGVGTFAMASLVGGEGNISIGSDSMYQVQSGDDNIAMGLGAMSYAAKATENVVIGKYAMQNAEVHDATIEKNVAIGKGAAYRTTGIGNVMVGYEAGYRNKTGRYNVIVGGASLGSTDGGDKNTFIGSQIYTNTSLHDSIGLGCKAIPTKSNQMMLGSTDVTEVVMCGNKKIIFNQDGTVTWEVVS